VIQTSTELAYVVPKLLKWAREQSGFTIEQAAASLLNPAKLERVENGEDNLTFHQLIKLANKYRRPPAFFYLDEPPEEEILPDFRTLGSSPVQFSPLLRDQIEKIKEKRDLAIKYKEYDVDYDYEWIASISIDMEPELAAEVIIKLLGLDVSERRVWKDEYNAFNSWKEKIEDIGILIFQILDIKIQEMRGFSIPEIPYPVIAINRSDRPLGKIFTLVHELCHIMLKQGGICTSNNEDEEHFKIEQFCNAVAGAVLVPKNMLLAAKIVKSHYGGISWSDDELKALKKYFWASYEVILRRLLIANKTTQEFYQTKINSLSKLPPKTEGGPESVYERILRTQPRSFLNIVLGAMHDGHITMADLSYYLGMSLKHLPNLEKKLTG